MLCVCIYMWVPLCIGGNPNDSWRVPRPIFWDFAGSRYFFEVLTALATDLMTHLLDNSLNWCLNTTFHSMSVLSSIPWGIIRSQTGSQDLGEVLQEA